MSKKPLFFDAKTFTGEKLPPVMRDSYHFICWAKEDFEITFKISGETKPYGAKTPLSAVTGKLAAGGGKNAEKDQRNLATAIATAREKDLGVGYYMRKDGNQTFLDLDGCVTVDEQNNPVLDDGKLILTDKANEMLALFPDTYWELSPSQTGLHGFVTGTIKKTIAKDTLGWLEAYPDGRYATMTGVPVAGFPAVLADGQKRLDDLYEKYVTPLGKKSTSKSAPGKKSTSKDSAFAWPEGKIYEGTKIPVDAPPGSVAGRYSLFFKFACSLRRRSISPEHMLELMKEESAKHCAEPILDAHLEGIRDSVVNAYEAGPSPMVFKNQEDGLFGEYYDPQSKEMETVRIGARLTGIEKARDSEGNGCSVVVEFTTDQNKTKQVLLNEREFHSSGRITQQKLTDAGYHAPLGHLVKENQLLLTYLDSMKDLPFSRRTDRPGWAPDRLTFTTSKEIFGSDERLRYEGPDLFKQAGSIEMWREKVARRLTRNSVGVFEMSAAFTSPILPWLGLEGNPAFLIVGDSTLGKTKCKEAAASVWGDPNCEHDDSYLQLCKTTSNGLESLFDRANDTGAIFDDFKQLADEDVENFIFMAATGRGKQRLTVEASARKTRTWSGVTLVSCEITSATKAAEGYKGKGKVVHAGSEVRMPNILVKEIPEGRTYINDGVLVRDIFRNGKNQGLFEEIWDCKNSLEFVEALSAAARANYGHAGPMFIRAFMADRDESIKFARETRDYVTRYLLAMLPTGNRQAGRVVEKFAAIAAGGELATRLGVTGWLESEAVDAVINCFYMWFKNWPGAERGFGASQIVDHALRMIQQNSSDFEGEWEISHHDKEDNPHYRDPKIRRRLGWRVDDDGGRAIFFMEPATFGEYFKAFGNRNEVAAVLSHADMLFSSKKPVEKRPFQTYRRPLARNAPERLWGYALALPVDEAEAAEVQEKIVF